MKSILMSGIVAVASLSGFGAAVCPPFAQIKADYAAALEVAVTNKHAASVILINNVILPLNRVSDYPSADEIAFAKLVDDKLCELSIEAPANWATAAETRFPKSSMLGYVRLGLETNTPYVVSLAKSKNWYCGSWNFNRNNATIEELVGILNECIDLRDGKVRTHYGYSTVEMMRREIQALSVKPVKKYLRRQGKSFVTKDGVNPCEGIMTELNTALNAPYFEGLNAWFKKIGINASVDTSKLPPSDKIAAVKNAILDADKDLNRDDEFVLKVCLGVDGYNAFVKEYNGEQ